MRIGAHLREDANPVENCRGNGIDIYQMFVTDPQSWRKPEPHPHADAIRNSPIDVGSTRSYQINVASLNNRLRMPSRKAVEQQASAAAELGAIASSYTAAIFDGEDAALGFENWRKLFERQARTRGSAC